MIARCGQGREIAEKELPLDSGLILLAGFVLVGCIKYVRDAAGLGWLAAESCTARKRDGTCKVPVISDCFSHRGPLDSRRLQKRLVPIPSDYNGGF